ncbi:MAG: TonB family protein [Myxococcales bacterium]|jgi:protein TonB
MMRRLALALGASLVLHAAVLALVRLAPAPELPAGLATALALELDVVRSAAGEPAGGGSQPALAAPAKASTPPAGLRPRARSAPPPKPAEARRPAAEQERPAPQAASAPAAAPFETAEAREADRDPVVVPAEGQGSGGQGPALASGPASPAAGAGGGAGGGSGWGLGTGSGAGGGTGTGGEGSTRASRLSEISRRLAAEANGCYPRAARRFRLEGRAKVRFCIGPEGEPQEVRVLESSGHSLLDQAALCVVARAAPFPVVEDCPAVPINFVMAP